MRQVTKNPDGSLRIQVDRRLFSRSMVKRAALSVLERCHVLLDLDPNGNMIVILSELPEGEEDLRHTAGTLGNLLVAELAAAKLDDQTRKGRNLLVARALDGALPPKRPGCLDDGDPATPPSPVSGEPQ